MVYPSAIIPILPKILLKISVIFLDELLPH